MSGEKHDSIEISGASLKYTRWQGGTRVLLCFHGFGQDRFVFKSVYGSLRSTHTIYSFDAFFHGESEWNRKQESFFPKDWFKFMELFFEQESIEEFETMGYSMGGKFAMITAQLYPNQVKSLHLLAPDGIKTHFSYRFSTLLLPLHRVFRTQIKKPAILNGLVRISKALGLADSYTLRFAQTQMDTEFKRAQVYYSWVVFRHFMPDLKKLADQINTSETKLIFYLGKHDKVINRKEIAPLYHLLDSTQIQEIDSGHSEMIDALSHFLDSKEAENIP